MLETAASPDAAPGELAPQVLVEKIRGASRLAAVDPEALAAGLVPGLTQSDALARVPELRIAGHDLEADRKLLERLADSCDRYTPMVATDPPDGLTLDITGCAHLYGGEDGLVADAERRLTQHLHLRYALAGTPEAAQALARFETTPAGDDERAIARLPIAALRLDHDILVAMRRAGLTTVGDLAVRPSAPLAARFGAATTVALARLTGLASSRIVPRRTLPALYFERRFVEPIAHTEQALAVIAELAADAADAMSERAQGGRRFAVRLFRSDGQLRDLAVESGLPIRDPTAVMRLFGERLDALADPIDPGFGFDLIRLAVPVLEPLLPAQLDLAGGSVSDDELSMLIDRLRTRYGRARIRRFGPRDTHIPEQRAFALPGVVDPVPGQWVTSDPGEPPQRPIHLFDPPQPIDVLAEVPDGPPHRFRWRRTLHHVTRFEGPERIAAEWWRHPGGSGLTRDYYRVEDATGHRFWIFRHGLYGSEKRDPGWYMHGLFA